MISLQADEARSVEDFCKNFFASDVDPTIPRMFQQKYSHQTCKAFANAADRLKT